MAHTRQAVASPWPGEARLRVELSGVQRLPQPEVAEISKLSEIMVPAEASTSGGRATSIALPASPASGEPGERSAAAASRGLPPPWRPERSAHAVASSARQATTLASLFRTRFL